MSGSLFLLHILPGLRKGILLCLKPPLASVCYWCRVYCYTGFPLHSLCEIIPRKCILLQSASCLLKCTFTSNYHIPAQHRFIKSYLLFKCNTFKINRRRILAVRMILKIRNPKQMCVFCLSKLGPLCSHRTCFQEAINSIMSAKKFNSQGKGISPAPGFSTYTELHTAGKRTNWFSHLLYFYKIPSWSFTRRQVWSWTQIRPWREQRIQREDKFKLL